MVPNKEWLSRWEQLREKTISPVDLNIYFEQKEIMGKQLDVMDIGLCSLPSGKILVRDPLCYLGERTEQPYFLTTKPGTYQTEVCVIKPGEEECVRYAAVRLQFSKQPAVRFEEALVGKEHLEELEGDEEVYFGFNVDAGLACICDSVTHQLFCDFDEEWNKMIPNDNLYDGYFKDLFAESYETFPTYQRSGGDWLNWKIPGTDYHLPIFQSGFGDGVYPVYWGYDREGQICQLIVQFIDIELAYSEGDEE